MPAVLLRGAVGLAVALLACESQPLWATPVANSRIECSCEIRPCLQGVKVHLHVLHGDDIVRGHGNTPVE